MRRIDETWVLTVVSPSTSCCCDLGVREPLRDEPEDLELALGQLVERRAARGRRARWLANRSSSRRVTVGASSASPAATTRIASSSSSAAHVLEEEAAGAGAHRLVDVLVEVERRQDQDARAGAGRRGSRGWPRCRRAPACGRPSGPRRARSARRARPPRAPFSASPTTSRSSRASRIMRKPRADERLVVDDEDADHAPAPSGSGRATAKPPLGPRARGELAAEERDALAHPDAARGRRRR